MRVDIRHLSFGYDKTKRILNNINFTVNDKGTLAIVGVSGSGKSTLLKLICGILQKNKDNFYDGEVKLRGQTNLVSTNRLGEVGFMFQHPVLFPNLNVERNIKLPLDIIAKYNLEKDFIERLIELVGLDEFRSYLPRQLSGGMQTRVALARTFVTRPKLLLLDEPFANLDVGWKMDLYSQLEKLKREHQSTLILVSHDIQEVLLLSSEVFVLSKDGRIIKSITTSVDRPTTFDTAAVSDYLRKVSNEYFEIQECILDDRRRR